MFTFYTPPPAADPLPTVLPVSEAAGPTVLILLDPETAQPRVLNRIQATAPRLVILLWVVTPGELLTWGALAAEPASDRAGAMLAALGERMAAARQRLAPLQWACRRDGIPVQVRIVHGPMTESIVKSARSEQVDRIVIPAQHGLVRGRPAQALAEAVARQVACPVELIATTPG